MLVGNTKRRQYERAIDINNREQGDICLKVDPDRVKSRNEIGAENKFPQSVTHTKLSYGWVVAIAGCVILVTAQNIQYSFGVFLKPLINQFGWSRTAISACVTIRSIIGGIMSPISGALSDRYGPKKIIFVGVLIVGLSYLWASRLSTLWEFYLTLGVLTGLGTGSLLTPLVATTTRWFGSRSGLANGVVMSGFSISQVILPPVVTYLILQYSWGTCLLVLGITALCIGLGAGSFIKPPPRRETNLDTSPGTGNMVKAAEAPSAKGGFSMSEAFHTPTLWLLLIIYMIVAICYQMVVVHIVAAAVDEGATLAAAAIILSISGVTGILGRIIIGGLANKFGAKIVLVLCLAIQGPVIFFLAGASDIRLFYVYCAIFGFAYSGTTPIVPTMAATLFGTRSVGSIFGIINLGYTFGVAIGPLLAGYTFDATGSYSGAFLSAAGALIFSVLLCLMIKKPKAKPQT
jgi:MFS family permease